jgi:hypothetical protein
MAPRVTWRLVEAGDTVMPDLESSMLPHPSIGSLTPILVRSVKSRSSEDGIGDVFIEYVIAPGPED